MELCRNEYDYQSVMSPGTVVKDLSASLRAPS